MRYNWIEESFSLSYQLVGLLETEVALSDWADRMLSAQRVLLDTAQRLQRQRDLMHMEQFNGVPTRFEIGSYVLV